MKRHNGNEFEVTERTLGNHNGGSTVSGSAEIVFQK